MIRQCLWLQQEVLSQKCNVQSMKWFNGLMLVGWILIVRKQQRWCSVHWVSRHYATCDHVWDCGTCLGVQTLGCHSQLSSYVGQAYVTTNVSKAVKPLLFSKKLKRTGVSVIALVYYYRAVIKLVLEYACPAWHSRLTKNRWKPLKTSSAVCFRLCSEMFHMMKPISHTQCIRCPTDVLNSIVNLNKSLTSRTFSIVCCMPAKRDAQLIGRLRSAKLYPTCRALTARFLKSFIPYSLANFQWLHLFLLCTYVPCRGCILCMYVLCQSSLFGCNSSYRVFGLPTIDASLFRE